MKVVLEVNHVSKNFYSTHALTEVSFDLREGEVLALAGENGAGKSTMMNILLGSFPPSSGDMKLDGKSYSPKSPSDALSKGISMIHQELSCPQYDSCRECMDWSSQHVFQVRDLFAASL